MVFRNQMRGKLSGVFGTARNLRYGFLALPGAVAIGFAVLAVLLLAIDRSAGEEGVAFGFSSGGEAGRSLLSTIAASLITVAGLTFSIMIVTLQLVSQQFSPRALRTFLGDRLNQFVAGYFIGVFVYCLLVLRTITDSGAVGERFVPALSITIAILLALGALALLHVFIDHMAGRIQVSTIAARVAAETLDSLRELYPEPFGAPADGAGPSAEIARWRRAGTPERVHPSRAGYVQRAVLDDVLESSASRGLRVNIPVAPGDFVTEQDVVAEVWHSGEDSEITAALRRAIVVGNERDLREDAAYGIRQLADIATRALSPSINDPTTAFTCIQYIRGIMEKLAGREFPAQLRRYSNDVVLVARRFAWEEYVDVGLAQVARYSRDPRIAEALLESALAVASCAREAGAYERLATLSGVAHSIAATVELAGPHDEERINRLSAAVLALANEQPQ